MRFVKISLSRQTNVRHIDDIAYQWKQCIEIKPLALGTIQSPLTEAAEISKAAIPVSGSIHILLLLRKLLPQSHFKVPQNLGWGGIIGSLNRLDLILTNLSDVINDEAPAIVGSREGLINVVRKEANKCGYTQEKPFAKFLNAEGIQMLHPSRKSQVIQRFIK